jgi:nucleoside-diphosphate-sugar epimerase
LLGQGHEVYGIDNLNEAYDRRLKDWRIEQLLPAKWFRFEHVDICDSAVLEKYWEGKRFDAVFNLAARAGVRPSVLYPHEYFRTNLFGTLNLLELARRDGAPKFVQASTSSLYGRHNPTPFREEADVSRPLSPYAASKGAAELLCHSYHDHYKVDISILRYFTVFGPAGRPDMCIFRFIQRILESRPLVLYGDGRQQRDFTYVEDIAAGTIAAVKPVGFEIINLGSDRPIAVLDVIETIEALTGRKAQLDRQPEAPADIRATWASILKASRLLGWEPKVRLEDGLRACIEWYQAEREWASQIDTTD